MDQNCEGVMMMGCNDVVYIDCDEEVETLQSSLKTDPTKLTKDFGNRPEREPICLISPSPKRANNTDVVDISSDDEEEIAEIGGQLYGVEDNIPPTSDDDDVEMKEASKGYMHYEPQSDEDIQPSMLDGQSYYNDSDSACDRSCEQPEDASPALYTKEAISFSTNISPITHEIREMGISNRSLLHTPSFLALSISQLHSLCTRYGRKTDDKGQMIASLDKVWMKLSPADKSKLYHHLQTLENKNKPESKAAKKKELTKDDLIHFIQRTHELHDKVLLFVPLELDDVHMRVSEDYKVSKVALLELLDALAVFVVITPMHARKQKQRKKPKQGPRSKVRKKEEKERGQG
jgi:hypothetical protein